VALRSASTAPLPMLTLAGPYGAGADAFVLLAWLALAGMLGLAVYVAAAALLRAPELAELRAMLGERRSRSRR
jgi:hypothetical protein